MIPIYENLGEIFILIKPDFFSEFLEKYIIDDCPIGAHLIFKSLDDIGFVKDIDGFRFYVSNNNMKTYELFFGKDNSKLLKELENYSDKGMFGTMHEKLHNVFKDERIKVSDMHSLILSKFEKISSIKLIFNDVILNVYITDEIERPFEKFLGSFVKTSDEETFGVGNLYKCLSNLVNN